MNRREIQAEILQTLKVFGDCVITTDLLLFGFTDDDDFTAFRTKHKLASTYDKASGQTTFTKLV